MQQLLLKLEETKSEIQSTAKVQVDMQQTMLEIKSGIEATLTSKQQVDVIQLRSWKLQDFNWIMKYT